MYAGNRTFTFANASSSSSSDASAWQGFRAAYLPISIDADGGGSVDLTGFQVGYVKSFGISANSPIFIETGANLSYISGEIDKYDEIDMNMFSINVPVNLGYQYAFSETASIFPYAGVTLRGNILGKYKGDGESISIFDSDLDDGWKANRFQIGWQVGVAATFNQFVVGVSYGTDFNEVIEGGKVATTAITVGYNF